MFRSESLFLTFVEKCCKSTEYLLQVQKWHAGLCNDRSASHSAVCGQIVALFSGLLSKDIS